MSMADVRPKGGESVSRDRRSRERKDRHQGNFTAKVHGRRSDTGESIWEVEVIDPNDSDPWSAFEGLERIDSKDNEVTEGFSDFKPVSLETQTDATEDHDMIL